MGTMTKLQKEKSYFILQQLNAHLLAICVDEIKRTYEEVNEENEENDNICYDFIKDDKPYHLNKIKGEKPEEIKDSPMKILNDVIYDYLSDIIANQSKTNDIISFIEEKNQCTIIIDNEAKHTFLQLVNMNIEHLQIELYTNKKNIWKYFEIPTAINHNVKNHPFRITIEDHYEYNGIFVTDTVQSGFCRVGYECIIMSNLEGGRRRSSTCREYFGHESTNKLLLVNLEPVKSDLRVDFRSYISSSIPIPAYKKIRFINHCCFIFPSTKTTWRTDMEFYGRRQRLLEIGERGNKIKQINIPPDLDGKNILLYTKDNHLSWSTCGQLEKLTKVSCESFWLKGCLVREHGPYTWYCNLTQHISYTDDIPSVTVLQAGSDFTERETPSMKKSC